MSVTDKPITILLVEDNEGDVELTREALEESELKSELHVAMDGEEALKFLLQSEGYEGKPKPDLILLDLNLPRLSGLEVLKTIKEKDSLKLIPTVILTSSYAGEDLKTGYDLQVSSYHIKPVNALDYLELIQKVNEFYVQSVRLPVMP